MSPTLAYQIGGVFLAAAVLMVLSFARGLVPAELRSAAKWATVAGLVALAGYAGYQTLPSIGWTLPSFGSGTVASKQPEPPPSAAEPPKQTRTAKPKTLQPASTWKTVIVREATPEEVESVSVAVKAPVSSAKAEPAAIAPAPTQNASKSTEIIPPKQVSRPKRWLRSTGRFLRVVPKDDSKEGAGVSRR